MKALVLAALAVGCAAASPPEPAETIVVHVRRAPTVTLRIPGPPSTRCDFDDGGPPMFTDATGWGLTDYTPAGFPINAELVMWCGNAPAVVVRIVEVLDP